ncbi:MAG: hypothetical protein JO265_12860 [Acidimicrobiia bacterium]|nr:hypothetical protein [Acidimicrobiia bacterium]
MGGRWWWRVAGGVAARPSLWVTAARQVLRLSAPGWFRRWPPVPAPDPGYVRFRLQTQYGDPEREPDPEDVVAYLRWCRAYCRVGS